MFLFNDTATPEIYTLSLHELFRSERVAVGRRILRLLGALGARGAADVRDHHRLSQLLLQQRRERPEDIVGVAARGPRHDELDGTLGVSRSGGKRQQRCQRSSDQFFHSVLLLRTCDSSASGHKRNWPVWMR